MDYSWKKVKIFPDFSVKMARDGPSCVGWNSFVEVQAGNYAFHEDIPFIRHWAIQQKHSMLHVTYSTTTIVFHRQSWCSEVQTASTFTHQTTNKNHDTSFMIVHYEIMITAHYHYKNKLIGLEINDFNRYITCWVTWCANNGDYYWSRFSLIDPSIDSDCCTLRTVRVRCKQITLSVLQIKPFAQMQMQKICGLLQ